MALANYSNATIAPYFNNKVMCYHNMLNDLSKPKGDLQPVERVEALAKRFKGDKAVTIRAYRALDALIAKKLTRLEDGSALVKGSMGQVYHLHDGLCECADWQKGYSAHIAALKAAGTLPPPPVE